MMTTSSTVKRDALKWTFALHLMARSALLPSTTTKAISIKSFFENAGSIEEMMLYTELQSAVHAMIQRLEYSFTFNPSLLTIPKRKQG